MGLSFFETMSGELIDDAGTAGQVAIDIRCDAARARRFLANGKARVTGTIRALPWTDVAACEGTVIVRPLLGRRIEYDLDFTDSQGDACRLWGRKDISARHVYTSMTTMNARLERSGKTLATGVMEFHSDDMLAFAKSWSVGPTVQPAKPFAQTLASSPPSELSATAQATLAALVEVIITAGDLVPAADATTVAETLELLPRLPPLAASMYGAGLRALDVAARSRYGKSYAKLSYERRARLLDRIDELPGTIGRTSVLALGAPIKMAHFARRDYLDRVGLPTYDPIVTEPEPRWMSAVSVPESMERSSQIECDVVIVGTGAGGGPVAAALAEAGLAVVMVEEGRYEGRPQFSGPLDQRLTNFWRDGGMNLAIGNSSIGVPIGRMVGGTTAINSGTCFRTPDRVLGQWLATGFPSDFEPPKFGTWLDRVESELQVTEGDPRYLGKIAQAIAKGAGELGAVHGPLRRNAPACDGQGVCVVGCPTGAKRSSDVTWVPRALRAGAQLYTGLPVTRILMTDRRAVGVLVHGQDRNGAPRRVEVRARAVVVAAGSLLTPLLLRRNGVALPWLGRNLSIHPGGGLLAMFPQDQSEPWRAIPQGYFVESDGIADELVKFEGSSAPPQLAAALFPFRGAELTRWMDQWARVGQFGFMVHDAGVGSVCAGPYGRPLIRYSLTPRVVAAFRNATSVLAELMLRGGAQEVSVPLDGVGSVFTIEQARAIRQRSLGPRAVQSIGFHPLGTARMGGSPDQAVVDFDHQVFGFDNLYVADGSCVPSSLGVNPQVTIMAMALRAADVIAARLA